MKKLLIGAAGVVALVVVAAFAARPYFARFMWRAKQLEAKHGLLGFCHDGKLPPSGRFYDFEVTRGSGGTFVATAIERNGLKASERPAPGCTAKIRDEWRMNETCRPEVVHDLVEACTQLWTFHAP